MSPTAASPAGAPSTAGTRVPEAIQRLSGHVVSSGATTQIIRPFTGDPLAELPVSTPADVDGVRAGAYGPARVGPPLAG